MSGLLVSDRKGHILEGKCRHLNFQFDIAGKDGSQK